MYKLYFDKLKGIILPHAGFQYAGNARKIIFDNLSEKDKNIRKIIYLSALHDTRNSTDKVFILESNKIFEDFFTNTHCIYNSDFLSEGAIKEHSFNWVKDELTFYFKNSKFLVICPTPDTNHKNLAIDIINYIYKTTEKVLLIATTDLIHYGERFNNLNLLDYPYTYDKIIKEEETISNLLNNKLTNYDESIMCGRFAIKTFLIISKFFNWNARVIDYYDSSKYNKNNNEKHIIDFDNEKKEFVSYVSIIYGLFENTNHLLPIDIFQSYGLIKSTLYLKLYNINVNLHIPKWNRFNNIYNGIFVSTEIKDKTNSCIGIFQNNEKISCSNKIINCAKSCLNDSIQRWQNPITINNLDKLNIKIEIIDDISEWSNFPSNTSQLNFNFDGRHGMYLKIYNNNTSTFLPSVAKDNLKNWTVEDYMNNLSVKSGSNKDDWKHKDSIMYIYKTKIIKYESDRNVISFN